MLTLVGRHLTNAQIAAELFVSVRTVETHVSALLRKLGAADRRALARRPPARTTVADRRSSLPIPLTTFVGRTVERLRARRCGPVASSGHRHWPRRRRQDAIGARRRRGCRRRVRARCGVRRPREGDATGHGRRCDRRRVRRARDVGCDAWRGARRVARRRNCLLVVDNCEHVQDAARIWLERLLSACRSLHVLATSRLRLMLPFEHVVSVPGLSLGTADANDAVALFIERMVAAGADRPSAAADLDTIAEICAALEGMALGIELAAARVPGLGLEALAGALGSRLDILDIGARADDRHRSLRAAIDWSYELLAPDERAVLRAAATFAAPADLDAICAVTRQPSPPAVLDALARLVDWNLASLKAGSPTRYRVLETIRQYAIDAAESIGEADALRIRPPRVVPASSR